MSSFTLIDVVNPGGWMIRKVAEQWSTANRDTSSNASIEELNIEARKQEIRASMARESARVAQELAIAERIAAAEEVEIEEFYDKSGEGMAGLQGDLKTETMSIGVSGSGKHVTKRIYKFRGFHAQGLEAPAEQQVVQPL